MQPLSSESDLDERVQLAKRNARENVNNWMDVKYSAILNQSAGSDGINSRNFGSRGIDCRGECACVCLIENQY